MLYFLTAATTAMLGFMVWTTVFRMRHDRVRTQRQLTRGKFAFRARERARLLLNKAFQVADDNPEWQDELVSTLDRARAASKDVRPPGTGL
jgi:hypothetical protein